MGVLPTLIQKTNAETLAITDRVTMINLSREVTNILQKEVAKGYSSSNAVKTPEVQVIEREKAKCSWRGNKKENFLIPLPGASSHLFPNIHSSYSFYPISTTTENRFRVPVPSDHSIGMKILFWDLMICDTKTTRTDSALPGDSVAKSFQEVLVLPDGAILSSKDVSNVASGKLVVLNWRTSGSKPTTAPIAILRIVHEGCPSKAPSEAGLDESASKSEIANWYLRHQLTAPSKISSI